MADTQQAYALAVPLSPALEARLDIHPELATSVALADQLAREMGWIWVNQD